ncbi:low molecular weight protein-tyrosine-phosphatase [Pseudoalteromonas sp. G4]|uniref:low molecular weight protein-tyrosine-phosphatase n=1 Tax=Pseudoalteromonas sp. G4 TaxID=2992761 RepID=UPI00237EC754|nr:low molecular weight protein-tyrosine-phosphatase [Pseudoalteromonas sp. G4]MDE3272518.1 low molecular weight phosphotyrosine protein phosphatase [Pseudoalteromonas sp. G4]
MDKGKNRPFRVLVVCMGNICRSPTGEAVLKAKAIDTGIAIEVDSAGTIAYHAGERSDPRSRAAGEARGYDFSMIRARQVTANDFEYFDEILCADKQNLADLQAICPNQYQDKIKLFLSYGDMGENEIPDPYYGGDQGFETVLDLVENACDAFLKSLDNKRV